MNRDMAQVVVNSVSRAAMEMSNLVPLLATHGEADKDEAVKLAIASAIYEAMQVQTEVFKSYPDLKEAAEARLDAYGRSYF